MSSQGGRNYTRADRALLWARSGGVCCFPECDLSCVREAENEDPSAIIGQIAHIQAKSDTGPRANTSLSDQERDAYSNLILLCPTHHRLVDVQENTYTVDMVWGWKEDRESRFQRALGLEMASISFAELETITQALVNTGPPPSISMTVIPPQDKMDRNGLTTRTGKSIQHWTCSV